MKYKFLIRSQSGQVIIILLLLMLVALSIGLALTQQSVTDVTTSTQTEQSSRALSAAEAGIEKALEGSGDLSKPFTLNNNATVTVATSPFLPVATPTDPDGDLDGIEYPPIGRETTAQFWFTDPRTGLTPYTHTKFDLYFGNESTTADLPAVEIKIVMRSNSNFYSKTYYYDSNRTRAQTNNFTPVGCNPDTAILVKGILGDNHKFYCRQTVPSPSLDIPDLASTANPPASCNNTLPNNCQLILARVRFLYINENHKLALAPSTGSGGAKFPPQVQIYNSKGISGHSEKLIQAFKVIDVVPPWFDFAVFSVNKIEK